jgi:serine/threonine protein kinase
MLAESTAQRLDRNSEPPSRKYYRIARLDRGGMADVYLALARGPLEFKKLLVVKALRVVAGHEELCRSMFIDEARLSARLNHPNVVQTYEISEDEGKPLIVMEYLEGQSLARLRKAAKAIDARRAARIVCDALSGLHYAHELRDFDGTPLNVVHRDLSPQNIFVTYEGAVKILDFGVARAEIPSRSRTKVGVLKGKFSYMAPEQTSGEPIDRRTDLFTVGIVLWELVAGRRMFGGTAVQKLKALIHDPIPKLSSVRPETDPELERIVHKALEKDRELRYATADAMREDLENYLAKTGPGIRSEDLSRLMLTHFAVDRQELRQEVQELLAAESSMPGSVPELKSAPIRDGSPSMPPSSLSPITRPDDAIVPSSGPVTRVEEPPIPWARERRKALIVALVLGILALAPVVSLLLWGEGGVLAKPAQPSAALLAQPAPVTAPSPEPRPARVEPSSAPPQVELTELREERARPEARRVRRAPTPPPLPPGRAPMRAAPASADNSPDPAPMPAAAPAASTAAARVRLVNDKPRVPIVD